MSIVRSFFSRGLCGVVRVRVVDAISVVPTVLYLVYLSCFVHSVLV